MNKVKFLILGAGPTGLSFATRLKQLGEDSFIVLEKENTAGGLCRSVIVDGSPFDIGGGHFLDVRRKNVDDFLFDFMPEDEWNLFERDSQIFINDEYIHHPIEANIWEMSIDNQVDYLKSIAKAGCNTGADSPHLFIDWIKWKLGDKISNEYMIPYNQKMFGEELNQLGTYWLDKLPDVSFEDTLRSCLTKHAYAKQPGHAKFYYPKKYGYGEIWLRLAEYISSHILYNKSISGIDFNSKCVKTNDNELFSADYIISTIPWKEFAIIKGMPDTIQGLIPELKHTSIQTKYFEQKINTTAHWIYYPDKKYTYHRILVRSNFCSDSKGYWTETNLDRVNEDTDNFKYISKYAYPLNTIDKNDVMRQLLTWTESNNVYGIGRWGEHQHYNSDVVVDIAIKKAEELFERVK